MSKDVYWYVSQCLTYQQMKYETKKPTGFLQPLPTPSSSIWADLSLDFVTSLPPSNDFIVILVIVGRFSKGAHFRAFSTQFTAYKTACLFWILYASYTVFLEA